MLSRETGQEHGGSWMQRIACEDQRIPVAGNERDREWRRLLSRSGQLSQLSRAVRWSDVILPVLERISRETDCEYWIGAGAVAQTVWNHATQRPGYDILSTDITKILKLLMNKNQ